MRKEPFSDALVRKSLARYFAVVGKEKRAKFLIAKKVAADFSEQDTLETLLKQHTEYTREYYAFERQLDSKNAALTGSPKKSYLDLKLTVASKMLEHCAFCSRRCGVNRLVGQLGYCGCGNDLAVSSIFAHTSEEPELVPSGTVFTMGCTIRCLHCQNWTISQWQEAPLSYSTQELAKEVKDLHMAGCRNINLVGGEPTPWLGHWLDTFRIVDVNMPIVWNSNAYYSPETAELLAGFADVYLLDFKYGPGSCAEKLSGTPNYWQVATHNLLKAKQYGELLLRVLVLPGHLGCCTKPILDWIAANLGVETRVNLMFQYRPEWRAYEVPELRRRLTGAEVARAQQLAKEAGLVNLA